MMHFLFHTTAFYFIGVYHSVDPHAPNSSSPFTEMQLRCMQEAFFNQNHKDNREFAPYYLHRNDPLRSSDVCAWTGIECTDGRVTHVTITSVKGRRIEMDPHWLPPTVEVLHVYKGNFSQALLADRLPRALRYLYLSHGWGEKVKNERQFAFDFGRFPRDLEEMYVDEWFFILPQKGPYKNILNIANLPRNMHTLQILDCHIRHMDIDWRQMPGSMELLIIGRHFQRNADKITQHDAEMAKIQIQYASVFDGTRSDTFAWCVSVVEDIRRECDFQE